MMHLLKNIKIGIDQREDDIDFNLNLYSRGTKANYHDDFPISIVRVTGARFEVVNKSQNQLNISNLYLGIIIGTKLVKIFTSSFFKPASMEINLETGHNYEVAFEGNELIDILDNYTDEKGILLIVSNNLILQSNYFDGDFIENELEDLNNDTNPEYQNWHTNEFSKLDIEIPYEKMDERLKNIKLKV